MRNRTEVHPEVIRPQHNRKHALPKSKVQKSDGEEPSGNPRQTEAGLVMNSYFLRLLFSCFHIRESKMNHWLRTELGHAFPGLFP